MNIAEFLHELSQQSIQLWAEDNNLKFRAPKGALTPAYRALLKQHKSQILTYLQQGHAVVGTDSTPPPSSTANTIPRRPQTSPSPLSYTQEGVWYTEQLQPGLATYNIPSAFRLRGPLDVSALEQSLAFIIQRHEILRTGFTIIEGEPKQIIQPTIDFALEPLDLRHLPATERERQLADLLSLDAHLPLDLEQAPLLRATLIYLADDDHILSLTLHHLIGDGWSLGVLRQELSTCYADFSKGETPQLPDLPIQYADFAMWQREQLQGDGLEQQLSLWRNRLGDDPPPLQVPTDYPRPTWPTYNGRRHQLILPDDLVTALKTLSRKEKATFFMTLLAAFNVLLYRYAQQDDILVGTPVANRTRLETEGLLGFLANTLVLRTDLSGTPTFRVLLKRIRQMSLETFAHHELPFETVVKALKPTRDLTYTPYFQTMFVLQNFQDQALTLEGVSVEQCEIEGRTAKFDLTLTAMEKNGQLEVTFEYSTELYGPETIERMANHWYKLLTEIVATPNQTIDKLTMLTKAERHQIVVEWNKTEVSYPQQCIHQRFEQQVAETPETIAVVYDEERLSYAELNAKANQVAHYLQEMGVGPDVLVGLCVERSIEMVIGLLGILKAGGAYVPIDPEYPPDRLAFMLEDAKAVVLLTQARLLDQLPEHNAPTICLDRDWATLSQYPNAAPVSSLSGDNLAYVIYTSGSTGKPKGAMIPHRAIANHMAWMQDTFPLVESDRVLQKTPFSFDASVWEFYAPLLAGAQLVIAKPEGHRDPSYLVQQIIEKKITVLQLVPSLLLALLEMKNFEECTSLKRVFCGGEALSGELRRHFFSHLPSVRLFNLYGPAEATIDTTVWECRQEDHRANVPIGRPIANVQTYVLDSNRQPTPIGVPGELYIGGAGLGRGYHNQPELTAERFVDNIFSQTAGQRLYKTGDLVRYLPDGALEFLGRIDHQVKVRGMRIELGEIEFVLKQHPAVRDAVVIVWQDDKGDGRLVAYLALQQSKENITSEIRNFAQQQLPNYMIPSAFMVLDALPLNPSGKVNRRALPTPEITRSEITDFIAPESPLEIMLAEIWQDILGIDKIGTGDNFFELGGHSLLAVRLIARIEAQTGKKIPLATLFQAPTIAQLVAVTDDESEVALTNKALIALRTQGSQPPLFCMPGNLGNVFTDLHYLVKYLPANQPFYAFQDSADVPTRIEEVASYYLAQLQTVQPTGPYFIAGICSGAVIAFEMAQQLQAQQQTVALLAMIEPSSPPDGTVQSYLQFARAMLPRALRRFTHHSDNLTDLTPAEQKDYLRLKMKVVSNTWAVKRYTPQIYSGQIHLFLSEESLSSSNNKQLKWTEFATEGAALHQIAGSHDTITGNNDTPIEAGDMRVLAEKLTICFETVRDE